MCERAYSPHTLFPHKPAEVVAVLGLSAAGRREGYDSLQFVNGPGRNFEVVDTGENIRRLLLPLAALSFDFGLLGAALALIRAAWGLVPIELISVAYASARWFST